MSEVQVQTKSAAWLRFHTLSYYCVNKPKTIYSYQMVIEFSSRLRDLASIL